MSVLASAVSPLMAQPTCSSISATFSMLEGMRRGDVTRFSAARTTPSLVRTPIAVEPSCVKSFSFGFGGGRET
jgi:hypothetical protein